MQGPSSVRAAVPFGAGASSCANSPAVDSFFGHAWPQREGVLNELCFQLTRRISIHEGSTALVKWPTFNAEKGFGWLEILSNAHKIQSINGGAQAVTISSPRVGGNRADQTVTGGSCNTFHASVNANNKLYDPVNNTYRYDAAGNMTYDGSHHYFYDAENRLVQVDGTFGNCSTATACYGYDAEGRRARKIQGGTTLDRIHDLAGNVVTEYCTNCSTFTGWATGYIYFGGSLLAQYSNSTTYFFQADHLGSTRVVTDLNKNVVDSLDYLPFGEQISGDTYTTHKFTAKERDAESGLDDFGARYNSSNIGRFMSPDPGNISGFSHLTDPQSWNAYAYVRNNPLRLVDPTGMLYCNANFTSCISDAEYNDLKNHAHLYYYLLYTVYINDQLLRDLHLTTPQFMPLAQQWLQQQNENENQQKPDAVQRMLQADAQKRQAAVNGAKGPATGSQEYIREVSSQVYGEGSAGIKLDLIITAPETVTATVVTAGPTAAAAVATGERAVALHPQEVQFALGVAAGPGHAPPPRTPAALAGYATGRLLGVLLSHYRNEGSP